MINSVISIFKFFFKLLAGLIIGIWNAIVSVINIIDGDDEQQSESNHQRLPINYNFRSGDIDSTHYRDGIYSDDTIHRDLSDY